LNGNGCGENQGFENLKATIPNEDYDRSKQPENVKYFNYFGSITNEAKCTCEIKSRIAIAQANSTRRRLVLPADWA
jgi:hypothetical protein